MRIARRASVTAAFVFALLVTSVAQSPHQAPADARFEKIAALVQAQMALHNVPGVAIGVLDEGRVTHAGVRRHERRSPAAGHRRHALSDRIDQQDVHGHRHHAARRAGQARARPRRFARYLPDFRVKDADASARATVRDTLTHMGGWEGDFFDDPQQRRRCAAAACGGHGHARADRKVGEMWGYNNAGFYAAGRVIEVITGQPFEKALQEPACWIRSVSRPRTFSPPM